MNTEKSVYKAARWYCATTVFAACDLTKLTSVQVKGWMSTPPQFDRISITSHSLKRELEMMSPCSFFSKFFERKVIGEARTDKSAALTVTVNRPQQSQLNPSLESIRLLDSLHAQTAFA